MYLVIWPNKKILKIQTPATTYIRITEKKRQATEYIIGGKQYHSIDAGYLFSYIFTPIEQIAVKIEPAIKKWN